MSGLCNYFLLNYNKKLFNYSYFSDVFSNYLENYIQQISINDFPNAPSKYNIQKSPMNFYDQSDISRRKFDCRQKKHIYTLTAKQ